MRGGHAAGPVVFTQHHSRTVTVCDVAEPKETQAVLVAKFSTHDNNTKSMKASSKHVFLLHSLMHSALLVQGSAGLQVLLQLFLEQASLSDW